MPHGIQQEYPGAAKLRRKLNEIETFEELIEIFEDYAIVKP